MNKITVQKIREDLLAQLMEEYDKTGTFNAIDQSIDSIRERIKYYRILELDFKYPQIQFFLDEEPKLDEESLKFQLIRAKNSYNSLVKGVKNDIADLLKKGYAKDHIRIQLLRDIYFFYLNIYEDKGIDYDNETSIQQLESDIDFLNSYKFIMDMHNQKDTEEYKIHEDNYFRYLDTFLRKNT